MFRCVTLVSVVAFASACSEVPPQAPVASAARPAEPAAAPAQIASRDEGAGEVRVSRELREICGISEDQAFFDFNSSTVKRGNEGVLAQLATCFTTGPMAGRSLRLVGHTDPRGEDSYNLALGERRATSVERVLLRLGLERDQVSTTSRGEIDASGSEESSWQKDRRVDIVSG
jgi:peptidoglycan-associated lipoprotein